jgi:hypothetical protein
MHEKAIFDNLERYKIPLLITGNSGDELELFKKWEEKLGFIGTGDYEFDYWSNWRDAYIKVLQEILPQNLQERIQEIVWQKPHKGLGAAQTKHLPFFKYEEFNVEKNIKTIQKKLGWKLPTDVGGTETDSAGLQFCVLIFCKLYGEERYAQEISKLIRNGSITREIALKALQYKNDKIVKKFFRDFDLSWDHLNPQDCSPFLSKWLNLFLPIR